MCKVAVRSLCLGSFFSCGLVLASHPALREFVMTMTFAPVGEGGPPLPESVQVHMAGRAFLVKKIDETVRVTYSDYRRASD